MRPRVIIPYAHTDERAPLLAQVRDWWRRLGHPVQVVESDPSGEWRKGDNLWLGAKAAHDAGEHVVIMSDADLWVDPGELERAVQFVANETAVGGRAWAQPASRVWRVAEDVTGDLLASGRLGEVLDWRTLVSWPVGLVREHRQHQGGGTVVVSTAAYLDVPIDPRFAGWGQEDDSWGYALRCLVGRPLQGHGVAIHLWHPPAHPDGQPWGSPRSRALFDLYYAARRDPAAMRALVRDAQYALGVTHA